MTSPYVKTGHRNDAVKQKPHYIRCKWCQQMFAHYYQANQSTHHCDQFQKKTQP